MQVLNDSNTNITSTSAMNQVSATLLSFCSLIGIPGNIAVMVVILRHFKKDNFTLHLLLNLAVSDIFCLISLPVWIVVFFSDYWILSTTLCKFLWFFSLTSVYCDLLTVTMMSVQRYLVVFHRDQWAKLGRKGERILLFCLWIFAFILSTPSAARGHILEEGQRRHCARLSGLDQNTLALLLCEILLAFVLPLSIIVSSYYCLHKKVNQTAFFSDHRLTKLVTAIVVTFVILWLPLHVNNFAKILAIALKSANPLVSAKLYRFSNLSRNIVYSFTALNSCLNPLLYTCTYRQLCGYFANVERVGTSTQDSGR